MSTEFFKVPQMKRPHEERPVEGWSPAKRRKIRDTFLSFCDIVLAYTQYNSTRNQEQNRYSANKSPSNSSGSTADSVSSDLTSPDEEQYQFSRNHSPNGQANNETMDDDTSFNEVTCFCGKPYMGRPMIECSLCYNWLHLSCVHLRKSNIPETYVCDACKRSPPRQQPSQKTMNVKRRQQQRRVHASHTPRHKAVRNADARNGGNARTSLSPQPTSPDNSSDETKSIAGGINGNASSANHDTHMSTPNDANTHASPPNHDNTHASPPNHDNAHASPPNHNDTHSSFHTPPTAIPKWDVTSPSVIPTPSTINSSLYTTPPTSRNNSRTQLTSRSGRYVTPPTSHSSPRTQPMSSQHHFASPVLHSSSTSALPAQESDPVDTTRKARVAWI